MRFEKELQVARSAAMHSGENALGHQSRGVTAEIKPDLSPVTIADRESEKLIAQEILNAFPDDGLLGEEGVSREGSSGRRWIIDPIDGTRDFVRGTSLWAVLIALEVNGRVVLGVSHLPARREMFHAVAGAGAYRNDTRIHASSITSPSQSVLCVNGLNNLYNRPFAGQLLDWMSQFWAVRSMGGCVDAMMLASGQCEAWIENSGAAWDLAPLKILFEEAGAVFMNFDGGDSIYGGNCIGCVPALEPTLRTLLKLPETVARR